MKQFLFISLQLLVVLCAMPRANAAVPECMGNYDGTWESLELNVKMSSGSCEERITLKGSFLPQTYLITSDPGRAPHAATCFWKWSPEGSSRLSPPSGAPDTIVCVLNR